MISLPEINTAIFKFQYLPDFCKFLLTDKLDEFTVVGIRFCRELDLPMMRPLAKLSENDLIELSRESNRQILQALSNNDIVPHIMNNIQSFLSNNIIDSKGSKVLDNSEVVAEDIILAFYIRRKTFCFFLHAYTQNEVVHMLIAAELDSYTTQEHLLTVKAMIANNNELKVALNKA